mgnify:CR=1 FL=1
MRLIANRKSFLLFIFIIVIIFAFHFTNGWINSIGVPVGLIVLLITGFNIFKYNTPSSVRNTAMVSSIRSVSKENIPAEGEKLDKRSESHVDLSVIGTEYREKEFKKFELYIDEILDKCIELIHAYIETQTTAVFFPTEDGGYKIRKFMSNNTYVNKDAVIYPGVGVIGSFLKKGLKQLKLTDIVTDSMTLYYYTKDVGIRSLLASPIVADTITRGIIIVDSINKNHFTDSDCEYLSNMADLCGQAVYNSYLYNQHKLDYARLLAMSSTEKFFFQEQNIDSVLDKLVEILPYAMNCDRLSISLLDDVNHKVSVKRVWGIHSENLINLSFTISEKSIANFVYIKSLCIMRNFSVNHYETRYCREETQIYDFRSFIAFPLGVENCKGMILLESLTENAYSENNRSILSHLVSSAAITIEKIHKLKQTENLAIRDGLTGLYNHRQFQQLLKEAITRSLRMEKPMALVICDIDHFKNINDLYGHRFGDSVLKVIASKLQNSIREGIDNSARYGGEEFVLILSETDSASAMETVERIRQQIENIIFQNPRGKEMHITMSFGIAVYGQHAKNQDLLIKRADKALYKAKNTGRNRVELYYEPVTTSQPANPSQSSSS